MEGGVGANERALSELGDSLLLSFNVRSLTASTSSSVTANASPDGRIMLRGSRVILGFAWRKGQRRCEEDDGRVSCCFWELSD